MRFLLLLTLALSAPALFAYDRVVVTAFDPFGGKTHNNSWALAQLLPGLLPAADIVLCELPTSYERAPKAFAECLQHSGAQDPLVISLGEGPCTVKWETRARNRNHDRGPDNDGVSRRWQSIERSGPSYVGLRANYASWWCALSEQERKLVTVSGNADTFVCNHLAYLTARSYPELAATFVHVPSTQCELRQPGLTQRSAALLAKLIAHELASEGPAPRLVTGRREVERLLEAPAVSSCQAEFLQRWRQAL